MPFENMSNLQAAYAAAFKQDKPRIPEDVPPDLAFIIQSCWVEEPNMRPSFSQVIRMLNAFHSTLPPTPSILEEPETSETALTKNGTVSKLSVRSKGRFAFFRLPFAARKLRGSQ